MTFSWKRLTTSTKVALIICSLGIFLRFFLHYSELGFFEFILFDLPFTKWAIIALLVAILVSQLRKETIQNSAIANFLIIGITFCLVYFIMTPVNLDELDWTINYNKRQSILKLAEERQLKNLSGTTYRIPFPLTLFPYIKSNDIDIHYSNDNSLTIKFYTDRGLLDNYSAFVYSSDAVQIEELNHRVRHGFYDSKKEANWYYILY